MQDTSRGKSWLQSRFVTETHKTLSIVVPPCRLAFAAWAVCSCKDQAIGGSNTTIYLVCAEILGCESLVNEKMCSTKSWSLRAKNKVYHDPHIVLLLLSDANSTPRHSSRSIFLHTSEFLCPQLLFWRTHDCRSRRAKTSRICTGESHPVDAICSYWLMLWLHHFQEYVLHNTMLKFHHRIYSNDGDIRPHLDWQKMSPKWRKANYQGARLQQLW